MATTIPVYDLSGKKTGTVDMPAFFSAPIREDLVAKVIEAKKHIQPYGPSPLAGNQHSASGILIHRRKVWKSQYGRGMSRPPRKIMSKKGSQFHYVGATVPSARGGRKVHSPKAGMKNDELMLNKKELKLALVSALSATAQENALRKHYARLDKDTKIAAPFVIEGVPQDKKVKTLFTGFKTILGDTLSALALKKRSVRSGKGTRRGRKYKSSAGLLLVKGKDEIFSSKRIDVVSASHLSVTDLANGGVGRLTLYTKKGLEELEARLK